MSSMAGGKLRILSPCPIPALTVAALRIVQVASQEPIDRAQLAEALAQFEAADSLETQLRLAAVQPPLSEMFAVEHPTFGTIPMGGGGGPPDWNGVTYPSDHHLTAGIARTVLANKPHSTKLAELPDWLHARILYEAPALIDTGAGPSHSLDFTSVSWFGTAYTFNKGQQSQAVRMLWEAWERGHTLAQATIAEAVESNDDHFQLSKVFRTAKPGGGYQPHPAWGTMIQSVGKGIFGLVPP